MEDHINVRNINFDNSDEVKKVALIHEEMPKLWNPEYNLSPAELDERIELIKTHGNNDDFIYLVGLSDDGEIVAIEWGEVKEIHNEKAVYISSIWVDDNFRGTKVVKLLNKELEIIGPALLSTRPNPVAEVTRLVRSLSSDIHQLLSSSIPSVID